MIGPDRSHTGLGLLSTRLTPVQTVLVGCRPQQAPGSKCAYAFVVCGEHRSERVVDCPFKLAGTPTTHTQRQPQLSSTGWCGDYQSLWWDYHTRPVPSLQDLGVKTALLTLLDPAKHQPADSSLPRRTSLRTSPWTSSNLVHIGPDDFSVVLSGISPSRPQDYMEPATYLRRDNRSQTYWAYRFWGNFYQRQGPGRGRSLRVCPRGKIEGFPPVHGARFNVNGDCDLISRDSRQHCNLRL